MAEHIAALENDIEVSELSSRQRKSVYVALYQYLPKLDRYGVIEYDKQRGTVELRDTTALDPFRLGSD